MFRVNRTFTILLLVALLVSACQPIVAPAPSAAPAEAKGYTPRFELADCTYPIPEGEQVECGYLIVPEDRSQPDGPTIRVQVVNFKSRSANPEPDPIILVPGGPGAGRGIYIYLWTAAPVAETMRANRDVLMIEHRGANFSEPAFYCPEMEADLSDLAGMSFAEEIAWSGAAYRACGERLAQEGHNLSLYGAVEAAADIADLRLALGYDQVNIYGVSYGTLPALDLMRDHPEGIRSVILDSIQPPEVNVTAGMLEVTQHMHQAIFRACASDPVCDEAYPNLEQVFYDLLAQLRANPVTVTVSDEAGQNYTVTVDDLKFLQFVNDSGFAGEDFAQLPAVIYTAAQGDLAPAAQGWLSYLSGRHGPAAPGTGAWSMGSFYSVTCLQDGSMGDVEQAKAVYAERGGNPSVLDWTEQAFIQEWLGPCADWPVTPPTPNLAIEPVVSDLPTLMMVNTFDIFYAPAWATPVAERLSHSYLYEFPRSHASILSACPLEMLEQFLADPTQAPDASCIGEMEMNWVLPE